LDNWSHYKNIILHPFNFSQRVFRKLITYRTRYVDKNSGYHARQYWEDRFKHYGTAIKGVGHEGLTEADNEKMYTKAGRLFQKLLRRKNLNWGKIRVLEIGCGNGYYTGLLRDQGVKNCTCYDITDVLFMELRSRFPEYTFLQGDITDGPVNGSFDLVIMIDVIEHIVTPEALDKAMEHIKAALAPGSFFIVSPIAEKTRKQLFYTHSWSLTDFERMFEGYNLEKLIPFRGQGLLTIRAEGVE